MNLQPIFGAAERLARLKYQTGKAYTEHDKLIARNYEIGLLRGVIHSLSICKSEREIQLVLTHELEHIQADMRVIERLGNKEG